MKRQGKSGNQSQARQQGAVAIVTVIFLVFIMIPLLGVVLDLGHLYIAKTELQNAADAAALSGAKRLDGTLCGISSTLGTCATPGAVELAVETAGLNNYDFNSQQVTISAANIRVGNCAGPGCMHPISDITSEALAADKTFLEVDTGQRTLTTWFPQALPAAMTNLQTFGLAVAGRYSIEVAPLGVCAVKVGAFEQGFLRGVSYNIPELNPLGVQADQIWINPIDIYPGTCNKDNASPARTYPFVCGGRMAPVISTLPGRVYYDTGVEATLNGPLNSRFGVASSYTGGQACDPGTAPPDANVTEFICTKSGGGPNPQNCLATPPSPSPSSWIDPTGGSSVPTRQYIETRPKTDPLYPRKPFNYPTRANPEIAADFDRYGVLWSFNKEINTSGVPYTTADWPKLYGGQAQNYSNVEPSPYEKGLTATGVPNRRLVNMLIMDCDPAQVQTVGSCKSLRVVAIGKFFMQRKADLPSNLPMEFAGEFETPLPPADIRLYR